MLRLLLSMLLVLPVFGQSSAAMPEQAKRGSELFFGGVSGVACGTCHSLAGRGTVIGPDLTRIAPVPAKGFVMAMQSTVTQYVELVKLKDGNSFPGFKQGEEGGQEVYGDLSKTPPESRKIAKDAIDSTSPNSQWKHPPATLEYTPEQLADIIAFVKWSATKKAVTVNPADLE